jgi:hypothetical protein
MSPQEPHRLLPADMNAVCGDPFPGVVKRLHVEFLDVAGVKHGMRVAEGSPLVLLYQRRPVGLHIMRAIYAQARDPSMYVDKTQEVRTAVSVRIVHH